LTKGLPFTHSRDTGSEIFHLTFDGFAEAGLVARVLTATLSSLTVHTNRMSAGADGGYATATELADTLVRRCGLPFRQAHDIVGTMVSVAMRDGLAPADWTIGQLREIARAHSADVSALTSDELRQALDPTHNVSQRSVTGGPAPREVRRMLEAR